METEHQSIISFFMSKDFLVPFLSTLMASLTIIFLQFIGLYRSEKKKKLYAISYISDICFRVLYSNLILKKHTIVPHIVAIKKIIKGDAELLEKQFLADEFDILTDEQFDFGSLPDEYKILIGCDNIALSQMLETIAHISSSENQRRSLNEFVKEHLKSAHNFSQKSGEAQLDCLNTYWDYLTSIEHATNRTVHFIVRIAAPMLQSYAESKQFLLFSKSGLNEIFTKIEQTKLSFKGSLPDDDFMEKVRAGGIQKEVYKDGEGD